MMITKKVIFSTEVLEIGAEAREFTTIKMAILFGTEAPTALRSSCFIINVVPISKQIMAGMVLKIDNQEYEITSVGGEVQTNLGQLGHIALSFTGLTEASLPGTLYLVDKEYPKIKVGSQIQIFEK